MFESGVYTILFNDKSSNRIRCDLQYFWPSNQQNRSDGSHSYRTPRPGPTPRMGVFLFSNQSLSYPKISIYHYQIILSMLFTYSISSAIPGTNHNYDRRLPNHVPCGPASTPQFYSLKMEASFRRQETHRCEVCSKNMWFIDRKSA